MIASLVMYFVVGVVALVVLGLGLALIGLVVGTAFALAKFLLFTVVPVALVGYVLVRFIAPRHKRLARAERQLLNGN